MKDRTIRGTYMAMEKSGKEFNFNFKLFTGMFQLRIRCEKNTNINGSSRQKS